ncbi:RNB domain-containing ribonuclease [Agrococcus casei]|uniref:RNB domain-containing ribonuclease n=1 Tax=Agrococcus casei TaxID=343512 RepID=UPI003F92A75C
MPARKQTLTRLDNALQRSLRDVREELELTEEFPAEALAEAERLQADPPTADADMTDVPFVTIDPEGSTDLDQALHFERPGDGFVVRYAIADVPAFVEPGGALDTEARERGQTLYAADGRIPLHPASISEDAASLLPEQLRSALVWQFTLNARGEVTETALTRASIRSREQLTYETAQQRIDDGSADESLALLQTIGELRIALEQERGGASLDMPEEQVVEADGRYSIERRVLLPAEQWNAQISLMTGMAAADLMLSVGKGILRTMPAPPADDVQQFRAEAAALGFEWPEGATYGEFLRSAERDTPRSMALLQSARRLFRGAGYTVLDGSQKPEEVIQAAIGAPYAHATAPLRRLVDRYVLGHCLAISAGEPVPEWASAGLDGLPEIMQSTGQRASALERASVDLVEIAVLAGREGEQFEAVVIQQREKDARLQLVDPTTEVTCETAANPGERVTVRLVKADLQTRSLEFAAE